MAHYLDIKILPDPEFSQPVLMNALFAKLHRALVSLQAENIGVSFPQADVNLGNRLRLHGELESLEQLEALNWRKGLSDYSRASAIQPVPLTGEYRRVKRIQVKSNAERLRRRAIKRLGISAAEALQRFPDSLERRSKLPFISLKSASTGQQFKLFIDQTEVCEQPQTGAFSRYGLGINATVPWF